MKWFVIGQEKLESEFDVIKILNTLRKVRIISRQQSHNKSDVLLDKKNLIDLDSDSDQAPE